MSCQSRNRKRRFKRTMIAIICLGMVSAGYSAIQLWPDLGGQGADLLRNLFGDQLVASLETTIFQAQDRVSSLTYRLGVAAPAAPWDSAPTSTSGASAVLARTPSPARSRAQYVAGNSLTLPMLVRTLAATGAISALQLDINIGMVL